MVKTPLVESTSEHTTQRDNQPFADALWTVPDVANYLRLAPETIRAMARQSRIPSIKMGRNYRFRSADIQTWLDAQIHDDTLVRK